MTGNATIKNIDINWDRFRVACNIAKRTNNLQTALLTGVGEPTLYPDLITEYLESLQKYGDFPIVELQTNGIKLQYDEYNEYLKTWYNHGLNTICLSAVSIYNKTNQEIYGESYPDLFYLIHKLKTFGYSIRLTIMMLKQYCDSIEIVEDIIKSCHIHDVDQLTLRPIVKSVNANEDIQKWTEDHLLSKNLVKKIYNYVDSKSTKLLELPFGANVYAFHLHGGHEQNVCMSSCLTETTDNNNIRQLICWPNGRIGYSWQHEAAIIM